MANAVAEYSDGECDAAGRDKGRAQQSCEFIERFAVTENDVREMDARRGDEEFACLRIGTRSWMAGLTCPRETVKARLGAMAQVLGGLGTEANAKERKRIADRVRGVIKRRDAKSDHPFPHLSRLPDDASYLSEGRFVYAYGTDPPAALSSDVVEQLDTIISTGCCRTTHKDIRINNRHSSSSALVPVVAARRSAPTLDMRDNASTRDVLEQGMQQMQQMQQQMQHMYMMQMRCMGMAGQGGADMPGFGGADMSGFSGFGMAGSAGGALGRGGGSRGGESPLNHFRRNRTDDDHLAQGNGHRRPSALDSGRDDANGSLDARGDAETVDASAGADAANGHDDIGLKHVRSMEEAQVAIVLDAKKTKTRASYSEGCSEEGQTPHHRGLIGTSARTTMHMILCCLQLRVRMMSPRTRRGLGANRSIQQVCPHQYPKVGPRSLRARCLRRAKLQLVCLRRPRPLSLHLRRPRPLSPHLRRPELVESLVRRLRGPKPLPLHLRGPPPGTQPWET